ncbi:MAG: sulfite exporter TauE/SafE family protein [Magnetococcales bacterium]|nr:sulfite exporter TauE/SafE family protein [Magnetococcales bacterium]
MNDSPVFYVAFARSILTVPINHFWVLHASGKTGITLPDNPLLPLFGDFTPLDIFFIALAVISGAMIQGAVGFGFALVSAPILMLLQPQLVPGPLLFAGLLLSGTMTIKNRHVIEYKNLAWLLFGCVPGISIGALLINRLSERQLSFLFGILVLLAVGLSLGRVAQLKKNGRTLTVSGLISGIMNVTTSMGGPPVAILYQNEPGPTFRGTLALYFFVGGLLTITGLYQVGRMGQAEVWYGLYLIPGVVVGLLLAQPAARWLDQGKTRYAVLTIAALSALAVLIRAGLNG